VGNQVLRKLHVHSLDGFSSGMSKEDPPKRQTTILDDFSGFTCQFGLRRHEDITEFSGKQSKMRINKHFKLHSDHFTMVAANQSRKKKKQRNVKFIGVVMPAKRKRKQSKHERLILKEEKIRTDSTRCSRCFIEQRYFIAVPRRTNKNASTSIKS
jgi:hypothetical protein